MSQLELPLHEVALVDDEIISRQPSFTRALVVCADLAGWEEKQAADAAGIDPSTWSKLKNGTAHFPHERLSTYQRRCGNWLPLQWLARDAGFGLVRLETVLERELRVTKEKLAASEEKRLYAESLLTGRTKCPNPPAYSLSCNPITGLLSLKPLTHLDAAVYLRGCETWNAWATSSSIAPRKRLPVRESFDTYL